VETFGFSASPPLFLGGVPVPVGESNRDGTTNNITPTAAHGRVHGAACEGVTLADLDSFFAFAPAAQ